MSFSSHDDSTVPLKYDGTDTIEIFAGFTGQNGAVTTENVKFSNASGSWKRVAYETNTQDINIDAMKANSGYTNWVWFELSDSDYGTDTNNWLADSDGVDNGNDARLNALNMLDYILWDGTALSAKNSSWTVSAQAYANLFSKMDCFNLALATISDGTVFTIKAGCQFPSVAYAKGESELLYVTTEDRMFQYDEANLSWNRYYNDVDMSGDIKMNDIVTQGDGFRYSFSTPLIWDWGTNPVIYMANNNRTWYNYITVNGKTLEEIAALDDSSYTYTTVPAKGDTYETPVWVMVGYNGEKTRNTFYLYIHQNYIDTLLETDGKIVIGVLANGISGVKDSMNQYVVKETVELDVLQQTASLTLNESLQFNYKTKLPTLGFIPESYETEFTFRGETVMIDYSSEVDGKKVYVFDGITPQYMHEDLTIRSVLKYNEKVFAWNTTTISVRSYCETLLEIATGELRTLLVDILNYGAAAQARQGITEDLANANIADYQGYATTATPSETDNVLAANQGENVQFTSATLTLEDKVDVTFKANVAETVDSASVKVTAQIGNGEATEVAYTLVNGVLTVTVEGLSATDFNENVIVRVYVSDVEVAACRYSVNSYAYRKSADEKEGSLVKALYAYGVSADAYAATLS